MIFVQENMLLYNTINVPSAVQKQGKVLTQTAYDLTQAEMKHKPQSSLGRGYGGRLEAGGGQDARGRGLGFEREGAWEVGGSSNNAVM